MSARAAAVNRGSFAKKLDSWIPLAASKNPSPGWVRFSRDKLFKHVLEPDLAEENPVVDKSVSRHPSMDT